MLRKLRSRGSQGFTSGLQVANLHLRGIAKGRDATAPILFPALLLLFSPQRIRICSVSEKNSSRKLADQARLPTPRYLIGMGAYEYGFPRMSLLGDSVNRGNPPSK